MTKSSSTSASGLKKLDNFDVSFDRVYDVELWPVGYTVAIGSDLTEEMYVVIRELVAQFAPVKAVYLHATHSKGFVTEDLGMLAYMKRRKDASKLVAKYNGVEIMKKILKFSLVTEPQRVVYLAPKKMFVDKDISILSCLPRKDKRRNHSIEGRTESVSQNEVQVTESAKVDSKKASAQASESVFLSLIERTNKQREKEREKGTEEREAAYVALQADILYGDRLKMQQAQKAGKGGAKLRERTNIASASNMLLEKQGHDAMNQNIFATSKSAGEQKPRPLGNAVLSEMEKPVDNYQNGEREIKAQIDASMGLTVKVDADINQVSHEEGSGGQLRVGAAEFKPYGEVVVGGGTAAADSWDDELTPLPSPRKPSSSSLTPGKPSPSLSSPGRPSPPLSSPGKPSPPMPSPGKPSPPVSSPHSPVVAPVTGVTQARALPSLTLLRHLPSSLDRGKKTDAGSSLYHPMGVAYNEDTRRVIVCDSLGGNSERGCVKLYQDTGEFIKTLVNPHFKSPSAAVCKGSEIFIKDNYCLYKFSINGNFLAEKAMSNGSRLFGLELTRGENQIMTLCGNRLLVCDMSQLNMVANFTLDTIPDTKGVRYFTYCQPVANDETRDYFVFSNFSKNVLYIADYTATYITSVHLKSPSDHVAGVKPWPATGGFIVASCKGNTFHVYDRLGNLFMTFPTQIQQMVKYPGDFALTVNDVLLVCNVRGNTISIISLD